MYDFAPKRIRPVKDPDIHDYWKTSREHTGLINLPLAAHLTHVHRVVLHRAIAKGRLRVFYFFGVACLSTNEVREWYLKRQEAKAAASARSAPRRPSP